MPKAASPVRLQQDLMRAAALTGERFHRSTAEQIEYWAGIGQRVASLVDPDALLSIAAGLAHLRVEPVIGTPLEPDDVFRALERQRLHGNLSTSVAGGGIRYQASLTHAGCLERIDAEGRIAIGQFEDGHFIPTIQSDT